MPASPLFPRNVLFATLAASALVLLPLKADAGALLDAAKTAEELAAKGNTVGAHDAVRDAFGAFAATLPFTIGKVAFVDGKPEGYGMYTQRGSNRFRPGEELVSYVEPVGLTWRAVDAGKLESEFTVDLELVDSRGEILAEQKAFGSFTFKSAVRNQEVFAKLTLSLDEPPAGDYLLRYRFRDAASGAVATTEQPFTIAP
ncbi:MAG: hypothetical protein QHC90_03035 [Shinella sp.]|nr:hypothetical protein [Shinella sp.]